MVDKSRAKRLIGSKLVRWVVGIPAVLSHLNLQAANIRNIHFPDQVSPSSLHLDTAIFDSGHGTVDGAVNFLAAVSRHKGPLTAGKGDG